MWIIATFKNENFIHFEIDGLLNIEHLELSTWQLFIILFFHHDSYDIHKKIRTNIKIIKKKNHKLKEARSRLYIPLTVPLANLGTP